MAARTVSVIYLGQGQWAHLRTTLPPKPGSGRARPYQQRIALGVSAETADGRRRIKALKARLEQQIFSGTFDWGNWSEAHRPQSAKTIAELVAGLEQHLAATKSLEPYTWKNAYQQVFRLRFTQQDEQLTVEKVIGALAASARESSVRKRDFTALSALAKFAELDVDLTPYRSGYSRKHVKPQDLPTDQQIVDLIDELPQLHRWACGMLATYGLRPSEIAGLEFGENGTIYVAAERKTGRRPARPLPLDWFDRWQLASRPEIPWDLTKPTNVAHTLRAFLLRRGWMFKRYAFRHCFARRCAERGISASVAARMMGHTAEEHELTYRAWIGESEWMEMFDQQAGS
ncbi:hypothetical protein KBY83_12125 [Cyanobium sp. WKJ7-Wakatipu]|uniref:hypothetical protein n=1 Tax=Cyanobium sp. WKJ7-Wakatipu TaxID=2823726 RepID=UPI0020CE36D7|nr:hypothetical protein [Cyanobium sp. WKJ7-Wakatipu]MCP9784051.1 hypothetical protein [Cyanobium sp. WKJ7-Wakatipu]